MQNLEWYLADLKFTGKNTIETVEKSLTDMFIRLVRIYLCLRWWKLSKRYEHSLVEGCSSLNPEHVVGCNTLICNQSDLFHHSWSKTNTQAFVRCVLVDPKL